MLLEQFWIWLLSSKLRISQLRDRGVSVSFWHWLIFDLPANISHLPTGAGDPARVYMPEIRHGMTDFGRPGYGGPCPPKGDPPHRYLFTVHALDVDKLGVASGMTAENLGLTIYAQALASATLTATYGR